MIALILSTFFTAFIFTVYGAGITKKLKIPSNFIEKLLIGFVVCNTLASYISLFSPINIYTTSIFFFIGLFLVIYIKEEIKVYMLLIDNSKYTILFSLPFILVAFILSIDVPHSYDTGLYHLQHIKWIEEYPVVPGLANLHGRFGFNPNIFTLFALTSFKDLFKQEIFSVNFTLFSLIVFYLIKKIYLLFKQQNFSNLFFIYFLFLLVILDLGNLSSPSPDFSTTVILLYIFARTIDLNSHRANLKLKNYFSILILCVHLLTIKLSAFPVLLLFVLICFKYKSEFRKYIWLPTLICLVVFPWITRNVITSGWLVYPFPSLDFFSFDWKVPIDQVINEKDGVKAWARSPGTVTMEVLKMDFVDWIPIWWEKRMASISGMIFILSIIFPILTIFGQLLKKLKVDFFTNALIISSFLGVVFWFLLAPDWRFGESFIIVASMSPLLLINPFIRPTLNPKFLLTSILIFLIGYNEMGKNFIAIALLSSLLFFKSYLNPKYRTNIIFGVLLVLVLGGFINLNYSKFKTNCYYTLYINYKVPPQIKTPTSVKFKTYKISDFDIYVPTVGDRCFCHDIPCSPYPKSNIVLRKNNLKSGFKNIKK